MKKIFIFSFCLLMFLLPGRTHAQVVQVSPEVIASGGGFDTLNMGGIGLMTISYTLGECITTTVSPSPGPFIVQTLTQGFQQPGNAANTLSVNLISTNSNCIDADNGTVMFIPVTSTGPVTFSFNALPFSNQNLYQNLAPGAYAYQITDGTFTVSDTVVITEDAVDCGALLVFYNGFTPNGDLSNDTWVIDGIDLYKENEVAIFNRWGDLVWEAKNYNNTSVVWDGTSKGLRLPDATYFYLISAGNKKYKGWVELTH
jgi:gliding motility-associated-like protein